MFRKKAYDTDGLWVKMWELGVRGKMWRVIKEMYSVSRSAVLLVVVRNYCSNIHCILNAISVLDRKRLSALYYLASQYTACTQAVHS